MNTAIVSAIESPSTVHQSKHGLHPCSYETFCKLRALAKAYYRSLSQVASWRRWARKAAHNRVITARTRNEVGQVTGKVVLGPMPEPYVDPSFVCINKHENPEWKLPTEAKGGWYEKRFIQPKEFGSRIWQSYCAARHPVPFDRPGAVEKMSATVEEIEKVYAKMMEGGL